MPRLDNSDPGIVEDFGLRFDEDDPGATEPVDLCWFCYEAEGWDRKDFDVDHPSYEDSQTTCFICGRVLTEEDD